MKYPAGPIEVARLLDGLLEAFAGAELRQLRGGNLDLLAGARVAPFRCGALGDAERAEADETDLEALLQSVADGVEHGFERLLRIRLGEAGGRRDGIDEFVLVHECPLMWREVSEYREIDGRRQNPQSRRSVDRGSRMRQLRNTLHRNESPPAPRTKRRRRHPFGRRRLNRDRVV